MSDIKKIAASMAQNILKDLEKFKMNYVDIGMFADQLRVELRKQRR